VPDPDPEPAPPTPIRELLDDFMITEIDKTRNARYRHQVRARIERIIDELGAKKLEDLSAVQVARALDGLTIKGRPLAPSSRSDFVMNLKRFTRWAMLNRHTEHDPLATLKSPGRPPEQAVHTRRALTNEEMARLLKAAQERPLIELRTIRRGRRKGQVVAEPRPEIRAKAIAKGRERWLVYLTVRWTALRRSEIRELRWGDIHLDATVPHIRLRARATKSKRADSVVLHPQVVEALRAFKPDDADPAGKVFGVIPDMKCLRADLKLAGIPYGDAETGYADFHAIGRVTSNTNLAVAGVTQRARQAHLRHTHPMLTETTYTDEKLLPIADEIRRVPAISTA
jgi:integrase